MIKKTKETIVTKSYIGHIFKTKLKIDNDTFSQIKYKEIFRNENNDVIVQFEDHSNVGYIYHMTKNLEKMDKISFTEYIPAEFYRRHREINSIAKILRDDNWKTHVRMGKSDYKLLAKAKDDTTDWNKIKSFHLSEDISKFEIGIVPQNNVNKRRRDDYIFDTDTNDSEETRSHNTIEETRSQNNVKNVDNIEETRSQNTVKNVENISMTNESNENTLIRYQCSECEFNCTYENLITIHNANTHRNLATISSTYIVSKSNNCLPYPELSDSDILSDNENDIRK